ncbi:MAG: HNH endonuclease [Methanobrevibacter sp.]|nr:HNH endonuclease [Methanobrevibacter sp.]
MRAEFQILNVSFKYNPPIKKAFKKGLMPEVKKDLYGEDINNDTVTVEHITPASQGGGLDEDNIALAHWYKNCLRGVEPIEKWVTEEMWIAYLKQFKNVKNHYIDGVRYIRKMCNRFKIDIRKVLG